jgi:hypothetical protein
MTHYPIVMKQGNNIYSFFSKYIHTHTHKQTDRHTFAFIYKKEEEEDYIYNLLIKLT